MQQVGLSAAWEIQSGEGVTGTQVTTVLSGIPHLNTHAFVPGHNAFMVSRMKSNLPYRYLVKI